MTTYKEAYMNCKTKEEFKNRLKEDIAMAFFINKDRLNSIEDAVNEVCKIHPDWSDCND